MPRNEFCFTAQYSFRGKIRLVQIEDQSLIGSGAGGGGGGGAIRFIGIGGTDGATGAAGFEGIAGISTRGGTEGIAGASNIGAENARGGTGGFVFLRGDCATDRKTDDAVAMVRTAANLFIHNYFTEDSVLLLFHKLLFQNSPRY